MRRWWPILMVLAILTAAPAALGVSCRGLGLLVGRISQPQAIMVQDQHTISRIIVEQTSIRSPDSMIGRLHRVPIEQLVGPAMMNYDLDRIVAQSAYESADLIVAQDQLVGYSGIVGRTRQPRPIVSQSRHPALDNIVTQEAVLGED